ncbi:MAG TPA: ABC transporter ATP-binding protein [Bacillota bacterium]|nr:ABC transporter ATP-binding protein [Bacillota bacterium]
MRYITADWPVLAAALAAMIVGTAAQLAVPDLSGIIIDRAIVPHHLALLWGLGGALLGATVVYGVLNFAQGYLTALLSQKASYRLTDALYRHVQEQSFSFFDRAQTGQLMSRATGDVNSVRQFVNRGAPRIVTATLQFVGTAAILLRIDPSLALLTLVMTPPFLWAVLAMSKRQRPASWQLQQNLADLTTVLQENIVGVKVVRVFAREADEERKFDRHNSAYREQSMRVAEIQATFQPLLNQLPNVGTVFIIAYGGVQVIHGTLAIGNFVAFNAYLLLLMMPLRALGFITNLWAQAHASADRIFEILDTEPGVRQPPGAVELPRLRGEVRFDHVSARYDNEGPLVLEDIDLSVRAGETVALVGMTGSGKSTLVQLVSRFYDPAEGRVLVDGHDLRTVDLHSLRSQIGFVLQDPFLFATTLRENIAFGRPGASAAEIEQAAKAARIHDFAASLPRGYETRVGERGTSLSGGQKQRVSIARAVLMDPRILVLDDATSSVDAENEYLIQEALGELLGSRTTFIIAHRLASVMRADRIVVLHDGRIQAVGAHEVLLRSSPVYRRIHELQLSPIGQEVAGE